MTSRNRIRLPTETLDAAGEIGRRYGMSATEVIVVATNAWIAAAREIETTVRADDPVDV